ncbi:hypothetical protein HYX16_02450 [Candidatus Woesearchaeota archaeon]|nr:hypothetical protein [Candidatus Woesearchaeota archaeon]
MKNLVKICLAATLALSGCAQNIRKTGAESYELKTGCQIYDFEFGNLLGSERIAESERYVELYDLNGDRKADTMVLKDKNGEILEISFDINSKVFESLKEKFKNRIQPATIMVD